MVPLVWSKGGKSFLHCSVIKEEKGGDLFFPFISVQPPEKQRKKERREKRGRREEKERKLKGFHPKVQGLDCMDSFGYFKDSVGLNMAYVLPIF